MPDSEESLPPICPYLPRAEARMSHRCLTELREAPREDFYLTALKYGHYLWRQGHAGRALLALTRALYADLSEEAAVLKSWPLPYAAIQWMVQTHPSDDFPGNPRISFQHQATRIRGARRELRQARAWAVWYLICQAKPSLPGDAEQGIVEPSPDLIAEALNHWGHRNEWQLVDSIVSRSGSKRRS